MKLSIAEIDAIHLCVMGDATERMRSALNELYCGLRQLGYTGNMAFTGESVHEPRIRIVLSAGRHEGESYELRYDVDSRTLTIDGANEMAALYAIFDFLEQQGVYFGLDGAIYPPLPAVTLIVPDQNAPWIRRPLFATRGLQPWPDFLNCITVFNEEDIRAYLEAMMRMRLNTLGLHVYAQSDKWVEPFLPFEYDGVGYTAFADTTATDRWGYLPQRTSRYGMGAAQYYDDEVFGSDAARFARNPWEATEQAQALWSKMFTYAAQLGIRTGVGFELHQLPDEIVRACPPEVRRRFNFGDPEPDGGYLISFKRIDPASRTARYILEARLASLLEHYPMVNYIQLWEEEFIHWTSKRAQVETPIEPFKQAYQFLRRHAPEKKLVIAGWGGVIRNFDRFHRELPEDVIFAALSDQLGWDPIDEAFGNLGTRERWPIPWLEDDPSMWFPQLHVSRFEMDMQRAQDFGCTGILGIHWRHRIIDPVAGYFSRRTWSNPLTTEDHYLHYARSQSSDSDRAEQLADWFADVDRNHRLLSTWTGRVNQRGSAVTQEFSGDYGEAFRIETGQDIATAFAAQQESALRVLGNLYAQTPADTLEHERLGYWYGQSTFVDQYTRAWQTGRLLQDFLATAYKKRDKGEPITSDNVESSALPLWLKLLQHMREAVLLYQRTVATRSDLGTLASIHNKFVRIAAYRLKASLLEFIDTLPPDAVAALQAALAHDSACRGRVIVPTRPSRLKAGESVHITAIAPGTAEIAQIYLECRDIDTGDMSRHLLENVGRRTYAARMLMPPTTTTGLEYRVVVEFLDVAGPFIRSAPVNGFYTIVTAL
jgi:hypothetical protein